MVNHKYVGMWVTADGYIRHELLPNGRYMLSGDHIDYVDDTGFTADGEFKDGVPYHAGMILYRETQ